jgi:hypothetical protein
MRLVVVRNQTFFCLTALAVLLLAFSAEVARADTCTFSSSAMSYNGATPNQTLRFTWDNTTGAVANNGASCSSSGTGTAFWDGGSTSPTLRLCGLSSVPGTVQPGFALNINSRKDVQLNMTFQGAGGHETVRFTREGCRAGRL